MIHVRVSHEVQQLGITSPVVGLVRKFEILGPEVSCLDEEVASVEAMLDRRKASEIPDGRNIFGEKKAHLKLLQNFYRNGFRRHNNLIDAANIASLEYGVSIGLHDASTINHDVEVRLSSGNESIRPLFSSSEKRVPAGQLVYASEGDLLAWIGANDVDADTFKITPETEQAMIVVLGDHESSEAMNRRVCVRVMQLLRKGCPQTYGQIIPTIRERANLVSNTASA